MIYGYARVSTDGQSVAAQVAALRKHGAGKVFREVASGAKTDRAQLRRLLDLLDVEDVVMVTRLDRLARSTRDLLNTLAAITGKKAGFRSLGDIIGAKTMTYPAIDHSLLSPSGHMSKRARNAALERFGFEQRQLRWNFVAARLDETENHAQQPRNLGNVG